MGNIIANIIKKFAIILSKKYYISSVKQYANQQHEEELERLKNENLLGLFFETDEVNNKQGKRPVSKHNEELKENKKIKVNEGSIKLDESFNPLIAYLRDSESQIDIANLKDCNFLYKFKFYFFFI
jgi:hypothetical protein